MPPGSHHGGCFRPSSGRGEPRSVVPRGVHLARMTSHRRITRSRARNRDKLRAGVSVNKRSCRYDLRQMCLAYSRCVPLNKTRQNVTHRQGLKSLAHMKEQQAKLRFRRNHHHRQKMPTAAFMGAGLFDRQMKPETLGSCSSCLRFNQAKSKVQDLQSQHVIVCILIATAPLQLL